MAGKEGAGQACPKSSAARKQADRLGFSENARNAFTAREPLIAHPSWPVFLPGTRHSARRRQATPGPCRNKKRPGALVQGKNAGKCREKTDQRLRHHFS